ncbi:hypothetical protein Hanom_Chr15g01383571 [Helianthus anomalus]
MQQGEVFRGVWVLSEGGIPLCRLSLRVEMREWIGERACGFSLCFRCDRESERRIDGVLWFLTKRDMRVLRELGCCLSVL